MASQLLPRHVFGLNPNVQDNLHYVDDAVIMYPAGRTLVLHSTDTKSQRFIQGTEGTEGLSALALSPSRKYVAVAERAEKGLITVYDMGTLKRRKVLSSSEMGSKEYVALSFSADGKLIIAQGGAPEWNLILWVWEKGKQSASIKPSANQQPFPICQALFHPQDPALVSVIGNGLFRAFRCTDTALKPQSNGLMKRDVLPNYTCHCWFSDERERVLLGTDTGEILLLEGGEVKATLCHGGGPDAPAVECIVAHSKGFVAGWSNGCVSLWEKSGEDTFRRSRDLQVESTVLGATVRSLAVSPAEDSILIATDQCQLYHCPLSKDESVKSDDSPKLALVSQSFHSAAVNSLDTCMRKPLIVTASSDRSIRVWNYADRTCELSKTFQDEALSVAFHPSGLHLLAGFTDKLRLMNLLMDDIRAYKEFPIKGCRECRFSNGGAYFAAVNGNTIQIYSTYTAESIGNLRGHNGRVRSIVWSTDDSHITTAGMDGAIYEWRLRDFKREREVVHKGCSYTSVAVSPDGRFTYACGSDGKLKELEEGTVHGEYDVGAVPLTQLALSSSGKVLFAASEVGALRAYKLPLNGEFFEFLASERPVTRLVASADEGCLFASSEDQCLFLVDVRGGEGRGAGAGRSREALAFAEEVLVTRSDLEERRQRAAELEAAVSELQLQTEYQLRLKDMATHEKVRELTDKAEHELADERARFEALLAEKNEADMEAEERLRAVEKKHAGSVSSLESNFQSRIMAEVERYQALSAEKEELQRRWEDRHLQLTQLHERALADLAEEYETKLADENSATERATGERDKIASAAQETSRQLEEDADSEIEGLKAAYEARLAQEREAGLRLKGENGLMKKKYTALMRESDEARDEIKRLYEAKKELYAQVASLERDVASLRRDLSEREASLIDKERRVHDLKKKNQELEKYKYVLEYKLRELKAAAEPREQDVANLRAQIRDMDGELGRYAKSHAALELALSEAKAKAEALQRDANAQRRAAMDSEHAAERLRADLAGAAQLIQDPKALKEAVKKMLSRHMTSTSAAVTEDNDVEREHARQREFLEKSLESLKRKMAKDSENGRVAHAKIMQENVTLLKEIAELRRDIKLLRQNVAVVPPTGSRGGAKASTVGPPPPPLPALSTPLDSALASRERDMQRAEIAKLRQELALRDLRLDEMQTLLSQQGARASRPGSRGDRLPPLDPGFAGGQPPSQAPSAQALSQPPSQRPSQQSVRASSPAQAPSARASEAGSNAAGARGREPQRSESVGSFATARGDGREEAGDGEEEPPAEAADGGDGAEYATPQEEGEARASEEAEAAAGDDAPAEEDADPEAAVAAEESSAGEEDEAPQAADLSLEEEAAEG